ncbi:MAG: hypothetical protein AAFP90_02185 [Planctomycetota bacterium]
MQAKQRDMQQKMQQAMDNSAVMPTDPQLRQLQLEYVQRVEKIAGEHERKKDFEKAREAYESLVRLLPGYRAAGEGVKRMLQAQAQRDRKVVPVLANQLWQDTGVILLKGMPAHFDVSGTWRVVLETDASGVEIPEKLRIRDNRVRLGSLLGIIVTDSSEFETKKPFAIRAGDDFVAPETGRLFLRMYDIDPTDNEGELKVLIESTFAKRKK